MPLSRRNFVRTTAALAGASLLDSTSLLAAPTPFVRRNIGNIDASNPIIDSYKTAVAAMQTLPHTDPTSWVYQAAIHGTTLTDNLPAWRTCTHGNYFFLSWHRMYLWFFERIVRAKSGDPNWALPYWDWENLSQRHLPPMFRTGGGVLTIANRGAGWNDGTSFLGAGSVNTSFAMAETPFNSFSSSLESPHGAIHGSIGGWMGSVARAAQDPIFWLHHCNIDRYWNLWLAQGGGRTMPLGSSASDLAWKNTQFTFFDENGQQVQLTGCDILRAQDQLNYVYECEPVQVEKFCRFIFVPPEWVRDVLIRFPFDRRVVLPPRPPRPPLPDPLPIDIDIRGLRTQLRGIAADPATDLTLELTDVSADRQPDVFWEVYVGLPAGVQPVATSPHFVGTLALFGHGITGDRHVHGEFKPAQFSYKIDRAVMAALRRNPELGRLRVILVPRSAEGTAFTSEANATLTIGGAALSVRRLRQGRPQ
ncbi:MAG: tyrosinase family protein [Gemmatimonadaceae bacterium]